MACADSPRFKDIPIGKVLDVEEPKTGHVHWPDMEVDLTTEVIAQQAARRIA